MEARAHIEVDQGRDDARALSGFSAVDLGASSSAFGMHGRKWPSLIVLSLHFSH
jgi:hypothetical protein